MNINKRLLLGAGSEIVLAEHMTRDPSFSTNRYRYLVEVCDWLLFLTIDDQKRQKYKTRRTETTIPRLLVDF